MYQHLPSPVKFREDINGLRAWAVIAVLLFHFSLIGLPGGFAGVDVFFVISGYLMTAIIVGGYEKGNFSIWKFYMSRARRILPALMFLITVLLVLGWFFLPTPEFQGLGKQAAYSLVFWSNIGYWKSSGYFDSSAHDKWLLHTWSLAVEAQFYVLYPIFIALIWRFWKSVKAVTVGVLLLFLVSLVLNLVLSSRDPSAAFYLLPTRGWELAAGALVFLIAKQYTLPQKPLSLFYWAGWLMVISSFFFIDETLAWPSYWAILPVLGTSLIVLANKSDCRLTNNLIAQWLGDRSYSLYLWHWPLVVGLYFASLQSEWNWVLTLFALSILLADLSYRFIETPTRKYLSQAKLFKEVLLIIFVGALIGIAAISARTFVFEDRVNNEVETIANEVKNMLPRRGECHTPANGKNGSPGCEFGNYTELGAILVGDSHAVSSVNPAVIAAGLHDKNIKLWSFSGCPTIKNIIKGNSSSCMESTDWVLEKITQTKGVPIVIINTSGYFGSNALKNLKINGFEETDMNLIKQYASDTICKLNENNKVYLVRPYPVMETSVPQTLSRNLLLFGVRTDVKITISQYREKTENSYAIQNLAIAKCGVKVLDPQPYLCDEEYCYGSKDGHPLYYDDNHLSEYGNKLLAPMFVEVFKK